MAKHVVWDWNGTLLDDFPAVVGAQNDLAELWGWPVMDATEYQDRFTRPLQPYYEDLAGRTFTEAEWRRLQDEWLGHYHRRRDEHGLAIDAHDVLQAAIDAGITQSVCSMYEHDHLVDVIGNLRVDQYFVSVLGNDGLQHVKNEHLVRHLAAVRELVTGPDLDAVMIGDTLDDAGAARHAGIACVLVTTGEMPRSRLAATGYPVADSLTDALAIVIDR